MRTLPSIVLLAVAASTAHAGKKYALADLRSLVADKAYQEALAHIDDIPPTQRTADWVDVAAAAAGGLLGTLNVDDGSVAVAIDQIDRQHPALLKSAKYTKPRADLGVAGLAGCFDRSNQYWTDYGVGNCVALGLRFVDNAGGDRALALRVAKLARKSVNDSGALPFFARALGGKDTKAVCKDADLSRAVIAGLGLPKEDANAAIARDTMVTCWDDLKDAVVKAFDADSTAGYVHQNACDQLVAKKLVQGLQLKQCTKK